MRQVRTTRLTAGTTFRGTDSMTKAISVRLVDSERALRTLEASGMSQSEAIRCSPPALRLRQRDALVADAAHEADDGDPDEMLAVAALMESLRATG